MSYSVTQLPTITDGSLAVNDLSQSFMRFGLSTQDNGRQEERRRALQHSVHRLYFLSAFSADPRNDFQIFRNLSRESHSQSELAYAEQPIRTYFPITVRGYTTSPNLTSNFRSALQYYDHIKKVPFETETLDPTEAFNIALYIEFVIKTYYRTAGQYTILSKKQTRLSRTIEYDCQRRKVIIVSKTAKAVLCVRGTSKKVKTACEVDLNPAVEPELVMRALTNKDDANRDSLNNLMREIRYFQRFRQNEHILHLRNFGVYRPRNSTTERVSLIFDYYQGNVHTQLNLQLISSVQQKLTIAKSVTLGLKAFHDEGTLHGDLKLTNFLSTILPGMPAKGVLSDLGFTFNLYRGDPTQGLWDYGYYGSFYYTSPEMFGRAFFYQGRPNATLLAERFALGDVLLSLFFPRDVPRHRVIYNSYRDNFSYETRSHIDPQRLERDQQFVERAIQDEIEAPFLRIDRILPANRTVQEALQHALFSLMRFDPRNRVALQQAHAMLDAIQIS